mmetsp:Transcript_13132/g.26722  ORF Transcript_13132/g.26722 Transcript_13132/m.26722 type:complete len:327 (+) Transcript_13132:288-1268(+)
MAPRHPITEDPLRTTGEGRRHHLVASRRMARLRGFSVDRIAQIVVMMVLEAALTHPTVEMSVRGTLSIITLQMVMGILLLGMGVTVGVVVFRPMGILIRNQIKDITHHRLLSINHLLPPAGTTIPLRPRPMGTVHHHLVDGPHHNILLTHLMDHQSHLELHRPHCTNLLHLLLLIPDHHGTNTLTPTRDLLEIPPTVPILLPTRHLIVFMDYLLRQVLLKATIIPLIIPLIILPILHHILRHIFRHIHRHTHRHTHLILILPPIHLTHGMGLHLHTGHIHLHTGLIHLRMDHIRHRTLLPTLHTDHPTRRTHHISLHHNIPAMAIR